MHVTRSSLSNNYKYIQSTISKAASTERQSYSKPDISSSSVLYIYITFIDSSNNNLNKYNFVHCIEIECWYSAVHTKTIGY